MSDPALIIQRIYGTSSTSQLNFAVSPMHIAYIASGGVVVSQIDRESGELTNQRFFCANNPHGNALPQTSAYSYLNMVQQQSQQAEEKDQYGIPKLTHTVLVDETQGTGDLSSSSSPPKAQQKVKTISCIAISPDEKYLAVGESGAHPRILLFSLAPDSNSFPVVSISEHSFGITALQFSPESNYLMSVGDTHDGFIYIWKISGCNATMVGVNKCTSQINGLLWNDDNIITYGVRYIKIWTFTESERKSMIQGKNVILGNFLNGNFVSATPCFDETLEDDIFFLTSLGEICGYNFKTNTLKLRYTNLEDSKLGVVISDQYSGKILIATDHIEELPHSELVNDIAKENDVLIDSPSKVKFNPPITCVKQVSANIFVYITSNEEIQLYSAITGKSVHLIDSLSKSVNGVKKTTSGKVITWTREGILKCIEEKTLDMKDVIALKVKPIPNVVIENHITAIDLTPNGDFIAGDAYGTLTVYSPEGDVIFSVQAHEFSINDVTFLEIEKFQFIISIGRDRMIQIFARTDQNHAEITNEWSIYQTLADHKANLLQIIFHEHKLYVSSADRSISIHKFEVDQDVVSINKEKTITVKSTPTSISISGEEMLVFTMDKQLTVFNLHTVESIRNMKLCDENGDSLLIDSAIVTHANQIVCSCSDKSIRIFNYITGRQLSVSWGHSEATKFLVYFSDHLITLSNSGCLFSWALTEPILDSPLKSTIQKYNEFVTPPKVTRKIKKPLSQTSTPVRKTLNPSPTFTRTPTTARLQSTTKMTPSKLNSSSKTNLSPSPTSTNIRRESRAAISPRSSPRASPSLVAKKPLTVTNRTRLHGDLVKDSKVDIDGLILQLRSFRQHMDSYTSEEVHNVKREITGIFQYEEELLNKYNGVVLDAVKQLMKFEK
ncbi:unnamed protein product [Cyberlindnera jadinii]|uniref:WD40 repeat-like protein n=1 Tax=Cyberlindnera jadinii (strain ATCC 18201 / CBS 1600 / BCRC 20928 / JCM 3617 / NBRC 0987 / NRRL Y-1542) TaxID=983966 RepID=A0A0H5CJB7_CYBJN|nr:unnamed protein product [Cyberlindnera jadinii]